MTSFRNTAGAFTLLIASLGCAHKPTPEAPDQTKRIVPLTTSWLSGRALMTQRVADKAFGIAIDLRVSDWPSASAALGTDSPCFRVALVERCENGIVSEAVPRTFQRRQTVGTIPIWCPAVGTSFQWWAEYTDFRGFLGYPGSYQPLFACKGYAETAVHLFPAGLRSGPAALPRPGIPLSGLQVTEWTRL